MEPEDLLYNFCYMFKIDMFGAPNHKRNDDGSITIIKHRQVGSATLGLFISAYDAITKKYNNDIKSFIVDWNRFSRLKAFI